MEQLFGVGMGKVIYRGVAHILAEAATNVVPSGGTRHFVYLHRVVASILKNFRALAAAMHARLALSRQRRTAQSADSLVETGRRLTSLDFLAFSLMLRDVLSCCAGLSAQVQSAKLEPWLVTTELQKTISSLNDTVTSIRALRCLAQVPPASVCCQRVVQ